MAVVVRNENYDPDLVYEPGFEMHYGLTEETCGITSCTLYRTVFPAGKKSAMHYHSNGDLMWYHLSGPTALWLVGEKKAEHYLNPGDFISIPRGEVHATINTSEDESIHGLGGYGGCGGPYESGKVFVEEPPE